MNGKDLLVFDMDGVLVDVSDSYRETIRQTVAHFTGKTITKELIQDYKNRGGWNNDWALSQKIIADLGLEVEYSVVVKRFQELFFGGLMQRERWIPQPGLLDRLSQRFGLAIFTGRERAEAQMTLDRFVPDLLFDQIVGDDDVPHSKPAPDGLLLMNSRHPGRKIVYVGDTIDDARCASAARVPFIGIAAKDNPKYEELVALLKTEKPIAILENVNELETVL